MECILKKIDKLLSKIRNITNTKNDRELCNVLNINYSTLDTWKNKDKIPEKRLFEISEKISVNYGELIKDLDETIDLEVSKNSFINHVNDVKNYVDDSIYKLAELIIDEAERKHKIEELKVDLLNLIQKYGMPSGK